MKRQNKITATLIVGMLAIWSVAFALDSITFEEKSSDPMTGTRVGLYAGDTAGANEAWWRRDDGSKVDLSAAGGPLFSDLSEATATATGNTDLQSYTMPADTLGTNDDTLEIKLTGSLTANGGEEATVTLMFGSTQLGLVNHAGTGTANFIITATVSRRSNTVQAATAHALFSTSLSQVFGAAPGETLSGSVVIKVVGNVTLTGGGRQVLVDQLVITRISA